MGMSARQFDLSIGTANGYILRMEKNNASVVSDVIERIAKKYPKINLVLVDHRRRRNVCHGTCTTHRDIGF
jgi:hypothetical protein